MVQQMKANPVSFFQSPLHRGSLFNRKRDAAQRLRRAALSVPSSSGKSLQLNTAGTAMTWVSLSVPSSSGKSLQRNETQPARITPPSFSPLFIGEVSSTTSPSSPAKLRSAFQSPLHRGCLFDVAPVPRPAQDARLSVPSSSGMSLQLDIAVGMSIRCTDLSVPSSSGMSLRRPSKAQAGGR